VPKPPPESTKTSLRQRLISHARTRWPALTSVQVRYRLASRDGYEDNVPPSGLPTGSPEEALDCACGPYLNDPHRLTTTPDELTAKTTKPGSVDRAGP
jgi:hypothetical protein